METKERKKLLIATLNPGKFHEICHILNCPHCECISIKDLQAQGVEVRTDFVEEGSSHQEIAYKKAKFYYDQLKMTTLADDSGILVDALGVELGVHTRRWGAGEKATDEEWLKYFLKVMEPVADEQRTARFVCCVCLFEENGESNIFIGETEGVIKREPQAPLRPGLPLSSVFVPKGYTQVYSEMPIEEKNKVSHRAKAMRAVKEFMMGRN